MRAKPYTYMQDRINGARTKRFFICTIMVSYLLHNIWLCDLQPFRMFVWSISSFVQFVRLISSLADIWCSKDVGFNLNILKPKSNFETKSDFWRRECDQFSAWKQRHILVRFDVRKWHLLIKTSENKLHTTSIQRHTYGHFCWQRRIWLIEFSQSWVVKWRYRGMFATQSPELRKVWERLVSTLGCFRTEKCVKIYMSMIICNLCL